MTDLKRWRRIDDELMGVKTETKKKYRRLRRSLFFCFRFFGILRPLWARWPSSFFCSNASKAPKAPSMVHQVHHIRRWGPLPLIHFSSFNFLSLSRPCLSVTYNSYIQINRSSRLTIFVFSSWVLWSSVWQVFYYHCRMLLFVCIYSPLSSASLTVFEMIVLSLRYAFVYVSVTLCMYCTYTMVDAWKYEMRLGPYR